MRKNPFKHPTYLALLELGRVIKTIFLCQYLEEEQVRREVNEGLNVVERWNGVNDFIFYGKGGEFASNRLESQELSVLSLHKSADMFGLCEYFDDSECSGAETLAAKVN